MITSKTLESLCYYKEQTIPSNVANLSYISMVEKSTLEALQEEREDTISVILGEAPYEEKTTLFPRQPRSEPLTTISPIINTMSIIARKYQLLNNEIIFNEIISYIDTLTNNNMTSLFNATNIQLTNDFNADKRKITSRIMSLGNYIAMNSRRGPFNCLIAHPSDTIYIDENFLTNVEFIKSDLVQKGKIILSRAGGNDLGEGLHVIKSDNNLFIKETPDWEKTFAWFNIQ